MDPISIALMVAQGAYKLYGFIVGAIQAAKEGDDAKALAELDAALLHLDGTLATLRAELDAVKQRIEARIKAKFGASALLDETKSAVPKPE